MDQAKRWPKVGDKLTQTYRKKVGQAEAEVISVDKKSGAISLRIGNRSTPLCLQLPRLYLGPLRMVGSIGG